MEQNNVWMIDDNLGDSILMEEAILRTSLNINLTYIDNAQEALQRLQETSPDSYPNLLIVDLNMPGMNGLEFIGKVKEDERLQLIPVVVMTTSSLNSDVRSAYKQLANAVVVKPIEFEDYIKTITAIHTFWLSTAKIARYE